MSIVSSRHAGNRASVKHSLAVLSVRMSSVMVLSALSEADMLGFCDSFRAELLGRLWWQSVFIRGAHIGTKQGVCKDSARRSSSWGCCCLCVEVIFRNAFSWTGARRNKGFLPVLFCSGMPVLLVGEFGDMLVNGEGEEFESFPS